MNVEELKKITVVGGGIMGQGIAMVCAGKGYHTTIVDVNEEVLQSAMTQIKDGPYGLTRAVSRNKLTQEQADQTLRNIRTTTSLPEAGRDADLVIEAVTEDLELKRKLFKQLDEICPEKTIFASNTSSMMVSDIASATKRGEKFAGMHWFNPAQVMKLIELIRGSLTSSDTMEVLTELSKRLGKVPVEASDGPGFFTTRFIVAMMLEGVRLFETGIAGIREIDTMCRLGFGFPMGPFELMDLTGLDTTMHVGEYTYSVTADPKYKPPLALKKLVAAGYTGDRKVKHGSKGGWYDYYNIPRS